MKTLSPFAPMARLAAAVLAVAAGSSCMLQDQKAPSLTGPSEQGLAISMTATPDILNRDGASRARIDVSVYDETGALKRENVLLRLSLSTTPAAGGALSVPEVVAVGGRAAFEFLAPGLNENVTTATIGVTPVGTNYDNSLTRTIRLALAGPALPAAAFSWTPSDPARFELATFDASNTFLNGVRCGTACTYSWQFGSEGSGSGMITQHRFQAQGVHSVTLTVTTAAGTSSSSTNSVTVAASIAPTASFTFSPTNPVVGDTVNVDGSASTAANGATIAEYRWNFGDGDFVTSTTPTATNTFPQARTYNVTLTVVDSNGQTATTSQSVTVAP